MDCGNIVGVIILARKAWQSQHCSGLIEVSAFLPILGGRIVRVSPFSGERNDFKNQYFLIQYILKKKELSQSAILLGIARGRMAWPESVFFQLGKGMIVSVNILAQFIIKEGIVRVSIFTYSRRKNYYQSQYFSDLKKEGMIVRVNILAQYVMKRRHCQSHHFYR
jgi:hypothetical protein